jgi:cell division septation protein DedD
MAGRVLSRRTLRDEYDQAEAAAPEADDDDTEAAPKAKKPRVKKAATAKSPKAPAKPRVRKKTVKAAQRTVARWAVCDGALKRVAVFEYRDRAEADARLAELKERKTGTYVLLLVKDPYAPPVVAV